MAKFTRWDPKNKKAGRKKNRSKLGLTTNVSKILKKESENVQSCEDKPTRSNDRNNKS